jgi:hypothetical protein
MHCKMGFSPGAGGRNETPRIKCTLDWQNLCSAVLLTASTFTPTEPKFVRQALTSVAVVSVVHKHQLPIAGLATKTHKNPLKAMLSSNKNLQIVFGGKSFETPQENHV